MDGHLPPGLPHANIPGNASLSSRTPSTSSTRRPKVSEAGARRVGQPIAPTGGVVMSPEALSNNERLFPTFRSHLSDTSSSGLYVSSAEKLLGWMSRDKAYYQNARPWVSNTSHTSELLLSLCLFLVQIVTLVEVDHSPSPRTSELELISNVDRSGDHSTCSWRCSAQTTAVPRLAVCCRVSILDRSICKPRAYAQAV